MNFNNQDRSCVVTLSAAKGLSRWAERCFAALSMTIPILVVKIHNRWTTSFGPQVPALSLTHLEPSRAWHPQGPIHSQPRPVPLHVAWPTAPSVGPPRCRLGRGGHATCSGTGGLGG